MMVERIAGSVEGHFGRQFDRQILGRNRHGTAIVAMDDRDRAAPVALARDQPVAEPELHFSFAHRPVADRDRSQSVGDVVESLLRLHAVEEA
jgi:hypothetical protein